MQKKQEILALTGLRGIAATVVMFYHFGGNSLLSGVSARILGHGYLMVDLFLILSGFIIAMVYGRLFEEVISWENVKNFLIRRIARIYPLYAVTTLTAGILVATGWMDHWPGPEIPVSAFINLTMLQSILHIPSLDTPGWSVSAEWIANLLFPLFALGMLCQRRSWYWISLIAVVSFVTLPFLTSLPILIDEPKRAGLLDIWNYSTVCPVIRCIADFILGMVVFRLAQLKWIQRVSSFSMTAPLLLITILALMSVKQADVWIVALFPLFILVLIPNNNLISYIMSSKPIYKLGELSYSIYLIHNQMNYFILVLAKQFVAIGLHEKIAHALAMMIFAAFVVLLADFTYRLIEKPARNRINLLGMKQNRFAYSAIGN